MKYRFLLLPFFLVLFDSSPAHSMQVEKNPMDVIHEDEEEEGCPDCPPVLVISINGVPGKDAPADSTPGDGFHDWVKDNIPGKHVPVDPGVSGCLKSPLRPDLINDIQDQIDNWREENPCGIVVVIGHSMGGITAWGVDADCSFYLDPPLKWCGFFSRLACPSMRAVCKAKNGGIADEPGYFDWGLGGNGSPSYPHTPFGDPDGNCDQLGSVVSAVNQCLANIAPNCSQFDDEILVCKAPISSGSGEHSKTDEAVNLFYRSLDDADIYYIAEQEAASVILKEFPAGCNEQR